ncbi:MAG: hypothetical protein CMC13_10530 [Flavobacteriaceae bacterium]|nr:hypothetical protein [Flavobacteriaceae bacterium]|tara:strand:+ start:4512 stop:5189 length:678 start_codon:yes stop_codon:yes gene_type:complete
MSSKLDFIISAINKVSKTNRIEGLVRNKTVTIRGTKKGFIKNEEIKILIEISKNAPNINAFIIADINGNRQSADISKEKLFDILRRTEMLDTKLDSKLNVIFDSDSSGVKNISSNLFHSKLKSKNHNLNETINQMAVAPLMGYRMHLVQSWPSIKNEIEIGFIRGTNCSQICFSHSLGWENEDFLSFFHNGVKLPKAIENCKKYGITKFIIYCNNEIMELKVSEL